MIKGNSEKGTRLGGVYKYLSRLLRRLNDKRIFFLLSSSHLGEGKRK